MSSNQSSSKRSSQRRYPPELHERAVRMVEAAIAETGERFGAVSRVAQQLGVGPESVRNWVKQAVYYTAVGRPPSARRRQDERMKPEVRRVHAQNLDVYGVRKVWRQMRREGFESRTPRPWTLPRAVNERRGLQSGPATAPL